jgi:hypothetical protein
MSTVNENQTPKPAGGSVNIPPAGIGAPAPLTESESLAEFQAAQKRFIEELKPRSIVEETLVFQIAAISWRLRRLPFLESVLCGVLFQRPSAIKELDLVSRHEARLMAAYERLVREMETRHKLPDPKPAPKTETKPRHPEAPPPPPPADFSYQATASAHQPAQTVPEAAPAQAATPPV